MRRATLRQTVSDLNAANYEVLEQTREIYQVNSRYLSAKLLTPLAMAGNTGTYQFRRNLLAGAIPLRKYHVYDLLRSEEKVGDIYINANFFIGQRNYTIHWRDRELIAYEVGLGSAGLKIPIYEGERQVALIEKGTSVVDYLDCYEVYAAEDDLLEMALLMALYYDREYYSNRDKKAMRSIQHQTTTTVNPKLWKKYQPDWVLAFLTEEERQHRSQIVLKQPAQGQLVIVRVALALIMVITLALFYWIMKG